MGQPQRIDTARLTAGFAVRRDVLEATTRIAGRHSNLDPAVVRLRAALAVMRSGGLGHDDSVTYSHVIKVIAEAEAVAVLLRVANPDMELAAA